MADSFHTHRRDDDASVYNGYVQALMSECKRRYPILSGVQRRKLGALARHARTKFVW